MMKKNLVFLLGACLMSGSILFTGCAADDVTAPVVTLNGDNPQKVTLNSTYDEKGATATDDEDGDLTSSIVITGTVDNNKTGSYEVHYSVSDAAGNVGEAHRTVDVFNAAGAWGGNYNVSDSCAGLAPFIYTQTVTVSDVTNNRITFNKFGDYQNNNNIYAEINGNVITLPLQTAANIGTNVQTHRFSGSGTKTSNGFILTYTDENVSAGASTTCIATFVK